MMRRALVTGASGFVGRHVVGRLQASAFDVVALVRRKDESLRTVQFVGDLLVASSLAALPRSWDVIVHLAGDTVPSECDGGAAALRNPTMLLNLLERVECARLVVASSAHVYRSASIPHTEDELPHPSGWYGLSKVLLEDVARFRERTGTVLVTRAFNQLGSGMSSALLVPTLMRKLRVLEESGSAAPLELSGLDAVRDFVDVRDVAEAYLALVNGDAVESTTVNICTGRGTSVRGLVQAILRARGIDRPVEFKGMPGSKDDVIHLVGSPARMQRLTGWRATRTLDGTLADIVDADMESKWNAQQS